MRILICGTSLRELSIGGGEAFVCDFANAVARLGVHEVHLAVGRSAIERVRSATDPSVSLYLVADAKGVARIIRDYFGVRRWAHAVRADAVIYPHEWKPLGRMPMMIILQNILWMHPATSAVLPWRGLLLRALTRLTARGATIRVALSECAAQLWSEIGHLPIHWIRVLPAGLGFDPAEFASPDERSHVLVVTGAFPYKGLALALAAVRDARRTDPSLQVTIAGTDGTGEAGITFAGFVDRTTLLEQMTLCSLVVFPSSVESFGFPAFEATAVGCVCVVQSGTPMAQWLGDRVVTFDGSAGDLARLLVNRGMLTTGAFVRTRTFLWTELIDAWLPAIEALQRPA